MALSRGKVAILVGRVRLVPVNTAGYRTLRVAGGVTFRRGGAPKSVLKIVVTNVGRGQNVLVE